MTTFNQSYWETRYAEGNTGWDAGAITTPIKEFIDGITDKNLRILVPGAGNGHEFEYLLQKGFSNAYMLDIAEAPLKNAAERLGTAVEGKLIHDDFFRHNKTYDLIIEQTFFCALDPELRVAYAEKMHSLLNKNGILAGLLFDFPLTAEGPPFGGSREEYTSLFSAAFKIRKMERAHNSIKKRQERELFFIFEKK